MKDEGAKPNPEVPRRLGSFWLLCDIIIPIPLIHIKLIFTFHNVYSLKDTALLNLPPNCVFCLFVFFKNGIKRSAASSANIQVMLTPSSAQSRIAQMSTHLRSSSSTGKEALLQKHPDDVGAATFPSLSQPLTKTAHRSSSPAPSERPSQRAEREDSRTRTRRICSPACSKA